MPEESAGNGDQIRGNDSMKKKRKTGRIILRILLRLLLLLIIFAIFGAAIWYVARTHTYEDRFIEGTLINGNDVGGMTPDEIEASLTAEVPSFSVSVRFKDGAEETVTSEDLDYHYVVDDQVDRLFAAQNPFTWIRQYLSHGEATSYSVFYPMTYDETKLRSWLVGLPELQPDAMTAPTDAEMTYADGEWKVIPEDDGYKFDAAAVIEDTVRDVKEAYGDGMPAKDGSSVSREVTDDYFEKAKIRSDDETLVSESARLNALTAANITYHLPSGEDRVINRDVLKEWLVERDGKLVKNPDIWAKNIRKFVEQMAEDVDTVDKPHKFKTWDGEEVMLPSEGYYGWRMDPEAEIEELTELINNGKTVEDKKPVWIKEEAAPYEDNYGFGDSYVEIDISDQRLFIYIDGEVKLDTYVVTGLPNGKRDTPLGAFFVYDKQRNKVLRGERQVGVVPGMVDENGKPISLYEYEIPVQYWARVTDSGVGMHDLPRGAYGGNIYLYDGSHGCINMSMSAAAQMYDLTYENMPIAIHE